MKILVVGLGRMGFGISERLSKAGFEVYGFDKNKEVLEKIKGFAKPVESLDSVKPEVIWIMVPHQLVDEVISSLKAILSEGTIVIDGGNSHYLESKRRSKELSEIGVYFLDVGVSGGVAGQEHGYCLMIGGDKGAFNKVEGIFKTLSYNGVGYAYLGPSGAGHFAKMVHNGIEYAIMQAIGEGFELLFASGFGYDLSQVARIYNTGSVIRSWLMELTERVFLDFGSLEDIKPYVEDTGEGRWTVEEAIKLAVPVPTIAEALFARFRSRQENSFRDRLIAGLRYEFGRHDIKKAE
ncbi:MAG: decarboxylating 6-phosphogluconate dehydrogenase [Aquificaceae bacterium]|nr:decarboxylating 6-phosphogluconate dehydrogenase [Aquificaceae bacterium]MDW8237222.1 decarboxylating 6-phosphogluconate dehydrogenase [Aquificaceae bacterium]